MNVLLSLSFCIVLALAQDEQPEATWKGPFAWTNQGLVRGMIRNNAQVFLGVPFAAKPKRWQPPSPPPFRWYLHDATKPGNSCPNVWGGQFVLTEDCLNLNIFAPKRTRTGSNLPVLVFWDGGAFNWGSNNETMNQAEGLANGGDMIVVVPNHRLGALGFMYIDELSQADGYKNNRINFAVLDMIRALHWVKSNIRYFGGDPSKVSISGFSSGGFLSSWLTTAPETWDLYNYVLQLEGPMTAMAQGVVYTKPMSNSIGQSFVSTAGCSGGDANTVMQCLANADIQTLVSAWNPLAMLPTFDGDIFPIFPDIALLTGAVKRTPTFMIAIPNPGTAFVAAYIPLIEALGWNGFLAQLFPEEVAQLFAVQYSDAIYGNTPTSYLIRGSYLISDLTWLCPLRRHANELVKYTPDVFVATWNTPASYISFPQEFGVFHGTEVTFMFGNAVDIITELPGAFNPAEALLSKRFIGNIRQFVRTGDPGSEYQRWVASEEKSAQINLDSTIHVNYLAQIRFPPSGLNHPDRCVLMDVLYAMSISGEINEDKLLTQFEKNGGNFWTGRPIHKEEIQ